VRIKYEEILGMKIWGFLLIAGGFEVVWATFMKLSEGFTKVGYSVATFVGMIVSFYFLSLATKTLPLGTAYAVWTGIGAVGAVIVGVIFFKEQISLPRIFFILCLLVGIIGLKFTANH
jgi:quaternary ammonium compound-resistance protein SugE